MNRRHFRFAAAVLTLLALLCIGLLIARIKSWSDGKDVPAWLPHAPTSHAPKPTAFGWAGMVDFVAGGASGFMDGKARQARFADPFGIALDGDGNAYVADAGDNNRIRKIATDGTVTTVAGSREGFADGPATTAAFHTPSGIAIDRNGNLLVADTGNNAIRKITPQGVVTTIAGTGKAGYRDGAAKDAQFDGPIGIAVDQHENIYVADTYNDRIRLITPEGKVKTLAGGDRPGFADGAFSVSRLDTPCGLAITAKDELLIADTRNNAIRKLGIDGQLTTLAWSRPDDHDALLRRPMSIAITHDDFIYIAEAAHGRILQMSPAGDFRVVQDGNATGTQDTPIRFKSPSGLALNNQEALYVADAAAYAVYRVAPHATAAASHGIVKSAVAMEAPPPATTPVRTTPTPWPVRPQNAWHEVVGTMGEVRGNYKGESRDHFHSGVDVQAPIGTPVLAIADEKVGSPISTWAFGELNEGLNIGTMSYIHMRVGRTQNDAPLDPEKFVPVKDESGRIVRVRVKRGTRFAVGDTLGTINRMYHVHLDFSPSGDAFNPLALGFQGFHDRIPPHIDSIQLFDSTGTRIAKMRKGRLLVSRRSADGLGIIVDAYDQVDGNQSRRRLGLYKLGFQVLHADGTPVHGFENPRVNIEFNRLPPDREAVKIAYAGNSGDVAHGNGATRFLYVVTNTMRDGIAATGSWHASDLPTGDYVLRILATDYAGNEATSGRDLPITIE